MAMQLNKTLDNGVTGNYWKITNIRIDRMGLQITVDVRLWVSQSTRNSGLNPLEIDSYVLTGSDYTTAMAASNLVAAIYDYLKALPDFSGEVDC
jgi:hypothetical protein